MLNQREAPETAESAVLEFSVSPAIKTNDRMAATMEALGNALALHQTASRVGVHPFVAPRSANTRYSGYKRVIDVFVSILISILFTPVLAICCAVIFIDSPGAILFKHRRVGLAGEEFHVWKFRSMCHNSGQVLTAYLEQRPEIQEEWIRAHKLTNDPRVTPVGRFIRRFSLDELPQLWNVIKGEMSLIGPRPIVLAEVEKYGESIASYYAVRPGMSGLWQVSGRSDTTYAERVRLDVYYSEHQSLSMDATIFLKTFRAVLTGNGAY
jgi:lipopolysaccharide/colanic/teichoic acid biosynthesis glycosyltransferase